MILLLPLAGRSLRSLGRGLNGRWIPASDSHRSLAGIIDQIGDGSRSRISNRP
jgi:hypothetical protein